MPAFLLDLRQAFRSQLRAPAFLFVAVLSLALGLGMNLAVFAALRAGFAPGRLWAQAERLVMVGPAGQTEMPEPVPALQVQDWRAQTAVCEGLAAFATRQGVLSGALEPRTVAVGLITPDLLPVLGVRVALGRGFQAGEGEGLLLTHTLWRSRFGGDPGVIGQSVQLDGRACTILGVLPTAFLWEDCDCFVPLPSDTGAVGMVGRLRPGVTSIQAQAALRPLAQTSHGRNAQVVHLQAVGAREAAAVRRMLGAAALGVLLLACLNVGGLLLGRVLARAPELCLRQALGAPPRALLRPILAEAVVIALPGFALGLLFAHLSAGFLAAFLPQGARMAALVQVGPWEVAFGAAMTAAVTLLCAWVPLRFLPKEGLAAGFGSLRTTEAPSRTWARQLALAGQVGLAMALLSGFALIQTSLWRLRSSATGFRTEGRLLATLDGLGESDAPRVQALLADLARIPGVRAVGTVDLFPVLQMGNRGSLEGPDGALLRVNVRHASEGYFQAAGIPLLQGRIFAATEGEAVLVSASLAQRLGPSLLGRGLRLGGRSCTVIGVVGDVRTANFRHDRVGEAFVLYRPGPSHGPQVNLVVHAEGSAPALLPLLRERLRTAWPRLALDQMSTLAARLDGELVQERRLTLLLALLAGIALALSLGGIHALLSREVLTRRREIGLRLSLGASRGRILTHVLRQGLRPTLLGLGLGCVGSLALARLLSSQLYGVSATDLRLHAGVVLALAATAFLACLLPALRAARVAPAEALRSE